MLPWGSDAESSCAETGGSEGHGSERMAPVRTKRLLVLFSSSFPFGQAETFLAAEFPKLEAAFDDVVVICNDISSVRTWTTGANVSCERIPYEISFIEKLLALRGLFVPIVWREFEAIRTRHPAAEPRLVLSTVLTSWAKAAKFCRRVALIASSHPGVSVYGYSYWANDTAVAVALARKRGLLQRAVSRAHGWDVYTSRSEVGFLPFRGFLADHLDSLVFVSADGRRFFEASVGSGRATREVIPLGTAQESQGPQGKAELFTIGSCSSLIPLKRVDLLAKAVMNFGRPIRWVHVGDGPERSKIEAICARRPPGVEIELTGHLLHHEVIETWRRFRPAAFVNVSASEGVPVSMMEAMSLGIPVIGTSVGGVPEIVEAGVNGSLLVAEPTQAEVAAALSSFADLSTAAFERLSEGAWRTWHDRFHARVNFARFVAHLLGSVPTGEPGLPPTGGTAPA